MTTTAFDDQFAPEPVAPVRERYDTAAILRRNIADMEVALKQQTERAEDAEAELAKLAQQKPVAHIDYWKSDGTLIARRQETSGGKLYAAPVPAPHKGATHCDDCGLTWLDDGLNPLRCPYCKDASPAHAVPAEWREVMAELAADAQAACDAEHPHRDQYPSVMRKYNNDMEIVEKARALLQSAEVQTSDKWQLTPCPTHPVDRNTGEVSHD